MSPGDHAVVLICQCSARHKPIYAARWVSRLEAERIAAELALNNGHNFMIVRSNGLSGPLADHTLDAANYLTGTNRQ